MPAAAASTCCFQAATFAVVTEQHRSRPALHARSALCRGLNPQPAWSHWTIRWLMRHVFVRVARMRSLNMVSSRCLISRSRGGYASAATNTIKNKTTTINHNHHVSPDESGRTGRCRRLLVLICCRRCRWNAWLLRVRRAAAPAASTAALLASACCLSPLLLLPLLSRRLARSPPKGCRRCCCCCC
jgi:hypothetical protein